MSIESKEIRSALTFDRMIRRIAVLAVVLYAAGCAGVTYLQISHLWDTGRDILPAPRDER